MGDIVKTCCTCKTIKSYSEFYKDKNNKDGHSYRCKSCQKIKEQKYYKTQKYKEKVRKDRWKNQNIDININQYNELLKSHDYKCAICGITTTELNKGLCVDHNHKNGKIRGLLCTSCNRGIGSLKDDINLLEKAIQYLTKYDVNNILSKEK